MGKVLHAINSINPVLGGTVEALLQIVSVSESTSQTHEILTLDDPSNLERLHLSQTIHAVGPSKRFYGDTPRIDQWLREHLPQYDCAVIHGCWQYHGLAVFRACKRLKIPYIQYPHGMLDPWFKRTYPLKHLKKWLYWPWAEYQILKHAERVIFTTQEECDLSYQSFWLYKVSPEIIPLGIREPTHDLHECIEKWLAVKPELKRKPYLIFLSRIHEKKGIDLLIEAVNEINCSGLGVNDRYTLVIVGPCNDSNYLEQLKKRSDQINSQGIFDNIVWVDMIRDEVKWGALALAEAFILPSHQENFGMVVPEALSCGTPVLITNKVNTHKEISSLSAGLVSEDNLEGIVSLLKDWTQMTKQERLAMRSKAKHCFQECFRIEKNAQRLFNLINQTALS